MTKYPKIIYVQTFETDEPDDENLTAWENEENAEDGKIAIYELKKFANKRTEIHIEDIKK